MSYKLKLTIAISLLISLMFGIGSTVLISTSFNNNLKLETESKLESFENVQNILVLMSSSAVFDINTLTDYLDKLSENGIGGWDAVSLREQSNVLYKVNQIQLRTVSDVIDNIQDIQPETATYYHVSDKYGKGLIVVSRINSSLSNIVLIARYDLSYVYEQRDEELSIFLRLYIIVVFVSILVSFLLSLILTRQLNKLKIAVRKIASGDYKIRSNLKSNDEFGELSRDFDFMTEKLEEVIEKLENDIERQEQFMGAFAHEIKTPMTSIIGFADLLRQDNLDKNTQMMASNYIFSESKRLERLSFKLLDLILLKKDKIKYSKIRLDYFVNEIYSALYPSLAKKGIKLVKHEARGVAYFEPDLVKTLLYNLIDNASKAIEGEGMIAIGVKQIHSGCEFYVADNGRGMVKEDLTKITEAFYRVDKARSRSQGGAGLGLALCKQIVEVHNGHIHFDSEPNKGTRVVVTLFGTPLDMKESVDNANIKLSDLGNEISSGKNEDN